VFIYLALIFVMIPRSFGLLNKRTALSLERVHQARAVHVKKAALARRTVDLLDYDGERRKVAYVELGAGEGAEKELILLGGCAQDAESFSSHFPAFERALKGWRVIIPEFRCQKNTHLLTKNATMETLCSDLEKLIIELNLRRPNLAGFSFGGRVALSFAASRPDMVADKVSLTGVSINRGGLGDLIIEGWRDSLRKEDMYVVVSLSRPPSLPPSVFIYLFIALFSPSCHAIPSCLTFSSSIDSPHIIRLPYRYSTARSFVINGYSREYLEKHNKEWLKKHVNHIKDSADSGKLLDLIEHSHHDDNLDTAFGVGTLLYYCSSFLFLFTMVSVCVSLSLSFYLLLSEFSDMTRHDSDHHPPFNQSSIINSHITYCYLTGTQIRPPAGGQGRAGLVRKK
jgi:pimeloyl-ACP methyl ester carboxylesterase